MTMLQLPLFDRDATNSSWDATVPTDDQRSSVELLDRFKERRLQEGAHPRSIARERSQLRSLVRESREVGGPCELHTLFASLDVVAKVICEPLTPIAASTGRARLIVAQRFIRLLASIDGDDAEDRIAQLDALLPSVRPRNWHQAGSVTAGSRNRSRRRGPTLDTQDLQRIVLAAGEVSTTNRVRNRALAALHCFSGLRPEEIVALDWEQIEVVHQADDNAALCVTIARAGRQLRLPIPKQAASTLAELASKSGKALITMAGPVFRPRARSSARLSYRAAREIVRKACNRAGLPAVEAPELRAAYARWLGSIGMSDHEIAAILGLERVRSVDRLLARHRALDAQRQVREVLDL